MTERTMRGLLRSAAACVPLLALLPSLAAAQTQPSQAIDLNLQVKRGAKLVENGTAVYADIVDCGGDPDIDPAVVFSFSVTYMTNVPVAELWLGLDSTDCSVQANRQWQGTATQPPLCTFLGIDNSNSVTPQIVVSGRRLFHRVTDAAEAQKFLDNPVEATAEAHCDEVHGSPKYTAYLIPLRTATTKSDAQPVQPVGTISTLKATFSPYTKRPEPPTDLTGVSGENRLEVNFKAPASAVPLTKYRAYFDKNQGTGGGTDLPVEDAGAIGGMDGGLMDASVSTGGDAGSTTPVTKDDAGASGEGAACGSGKLRARALEPSGPGISKTSPSDSKSAALTDLSGVEINQSVAASAVSIDPAGNESPLARPICVTRKVTTGFLETCEAAGEGNCDLHSCSIDPTSKGSTLSAALFILALATLIRRRGRA